MIIADDYRALLTRKAAVDPMTGLAEVGPLPPQLFPFQADLTRWALRRGRAAIWADCGLGKTPMQLAWANQIPGDVLIVAPLAVSAQTVREGEKFGIDVRYAKRPDDITARLTITNYERLDAFDCSRFAGVVLDESSILKAYDGKTRTQLIESFRQTPYRLCCTATPAPNDYMEIGNHAEFLSVMSRSEMLSMFFVHDGGETQQWRLKGHAERDFWRWLCSWAMMLRKPSDLGYDDAAFTLPELVLHECVVETNEPPEGYLFPVIAQTLPERLAARRSSITDRVAKCAALIGASETGQWLVWCNLNSESQAITRLIPGAVEVTGSDSAEWKEAAAEWFTGQKCLCNEPLFRTKLLRQWQSASDAIPSICTSIISPIATGGRDELKNREIDTTRNVVSSIDPIRVCENDSKDKSLKVDDYGRMSNLRTISKPTDSQFKTTTAFSHPKMDAVRFADEQQLGTGELSASTLTIATTPNESEDYFALAAISDSENLETIQVDSNQQPCICGHQSGRRILVSKPSIFGWGLNFQQCAQMAFVGLSDSYESFYQAVRRCWRFGQTQPVQVHLITADTEGAVVANIRRKEHDAMRMADAMVAHMQDMNAAALRGASQRFKTDYVRECATGENWTAHLGDCIDVVGELAADSVDFSVYSPPFSSLYTYSASDRDMGNCQDDAMFMDHYRLIVRELFRVTKPGRLTSFHCMNLPTNKTHHGHIGIRDFRGDLIRAHEAEGWIYHSEVCIWKDPVTVMQRTKALGLLHKQLKKDSCLSRQGIPDYLVTMRKPGENADRVRHTNETFPVSEWQQIASPIWTDINPSDTLQFRSAREQQDERHIAPLQLEVIRRALRLWSNHGDVVLSPFMGIGSEGYVSIQMDRRFIGAELKRSYWEQACRNLATAKQDAGELFRETEEQP